MKEEAERLWSPYNWIFGACFRRKGKNHEKSKKNKSPYSLFYRHAGGPVRGAELISVPLPFAPSFLRLDIAELPALFAGFFLGPAGGCVVILVKILLKLLFQGTDTAYVGELMNLAGSSAFVLTASLIYKFHRTRRGAVAGLAISTVLVSVVFIFLNAYVAFPMYASLYGLPMEAIIGMGSAANPLTHDTVTLMLYAVFRSTCSSTRPRL